MGTRRHCAKALVLPAASPRPQACNSRVHENLWVLSGSPLATRGGAVVRPNARGRWTDFRTASDGGAAAVLGAVRRVARRRREEAGALCRLVRRRCRAAAAMCKSKTSVSLSGARAKGGSHWKGARGKTLLRAGGRARPHARHRGRPRAARHGGGGREGARPAAYACARKDARAAQPASQSLSPR